MKRISIVLFLYLFSTTSFGQAPDTIRLTLVGAISHAIENNLQLKRVQLNEENNWFKIKELKSSALPQINGSGSATDNFKRGSQLLPGDIMGRPGTTIPVQFGTRFTYGSTIQLSQTLFNPSLKTGLRAAKGSQALYELQTFASKEELVYNLVDAYMQLQMSQKQKELIEGNLERTAK
ncbi:MAG TPA: TolC family protein, partial [Flavisolibacter sp.]|nr:TolC family protein [Flavisolibacter sp.]